MKLILLLITLYFLPVKQGLSQTGYKLSNTKIQRLDSIATQDVPPNAPGIATAIIKNGKVIYQKCAGYADFTDSSLITPATRFNIASNGKQFTALAILCLADEKKLQLTDDIRKWFPNLFPKIKEKITLQNLISHTSGIRDCYDLWSLQGYTWWKQSFNNDDVLDLIAKQEDLNFVPHSKYLYSNTNYILLALIIEKVAGKSFVACTNELFKKLNMPHTSFEDNYAKIQGPIARSYFNFGTWTTYDWIWNVCGDGNIFSTLSDQIIWEKLIQGKGQTAINRNILLQSQQIMEGSTFKNYGYGLEFGEYKGRKYSFHEGATGASKATVIRFPSENISMITFTNTGKSIPSMQTRQMADILFDLKENQNNFLTAPADMGKYVEEEEIQGIYLTENDFIFQFEKRADKIFLIRNGRNDVELEREADNIFHQKFDPAFKQAFNTNKNGEMQVTAYYTTHAPYTLTKAKANFQGFDFNALNGKYLNTETHTNLELNFKQDKTYLVKTGSGDSTTGLLITPTKFLVDNYAIDIEKNKTGMTTLFVNGDRIKRIKFIRVK